MTDQPTIRSYMLDVRPGSAYAVITDLNDTGQAYPVRMEVSQDGLTWTLTLVPPPEDTSLDALDRLTVMAHDDQEDPS